ncbi:MAG TPA: hypothetical protein VHM02_00635, partial [Thermoanaerobaculia bacterium]|nr:hypothetical protein [Thermoanaerobaculia bacterium]
MRAAALAAAAVLSLTALPAAADWLVMRDGTRVETRGAWQQKGRLVVFTSTEGRLSSLRTDAVDLAASRRATEQAAAAAARPAEPAALPAPAPRAV